MDDTSTRVCRKNTVTKMFAISEMCVRHAWIGRGRNGISRKMKRAVKQKTNRILITCWEFLECKYPEYRKMKLFVFSFPREEKLAIRNSWVPSWWARWLSRFLFAWAILMNAWRAKNHLKKNKNEYMCVCVSLGRVRLRICVECHSKCFGCVNIK